MSPRVVARSGLIVLGGLFAVVILWRLAAPDGSAPTAETPAAVRPAAQAARIPPDSGTLTSDVPGASRAATATSPTLAASQMEPAPPRGVTPAQWKQLREVLADHPQREAETARLTHYLAFQNDFEQFRQMRSQGDAASSALVVLARALDAQLADRLSRREMQAGEARLVKLALLEVLEPDATARNAALAAWAQAESVLAGGRSTADPREAAFHAQQQALVAAWRALPLEQRDARKLEVQLEALRNKVFAEPAR